MDSFEKKSLKKTNSQQFHLLVSLMQENLQLAKCFPDSPNMKMSMEDAWNEVARKLNSYGPPERTGHEWKKVWGDLKSRTKKKIFKKNKIFGNSVEAPCLSVYLNDLELSIDRMLNLSAMTTSQILDEQHEDLTSENDFNDPLKLCEVTTDAIDSLANAQIPKNSEIFTAKKKNTLSRVRLLGKRKYERTEKQLKLLQQQIKGQEQILETMKMQVVATQLIAGASNRQVEAMTLIAESTQSIAKAVQEAVKYLKSD